MPPTAAPTPSEPRDSPMHGVLLLVGLSAAGLALCAAAGGIAGGLDTALAAAAGMLAAVVGGLAGGLAVTLLNRAQAPVTAAPMLGMAVRMLVTTASVGFAILGVELARKPVLFAALFGYLLMMAAEAFLLYRFASRPRSAAPKQCENND